VRVPVIGGTLILTSLDAEKLWEAEREVRFSVAVQDLDLTRLSQAMGWPRLTGSIAGSIPSVTIGEGSVHTEGEILAHIFGGVVQVRNLRIDQLLSPIPTLKLDVDFQDISLGQLTDTLDVGHVSGVARGAVHDLAIVNRQPLQFEASMETVDKPGVAQRISITALHQISILAGPGGDALTQGILSFFDEYGYAKMGFRCRLENDRFTLHGVKESDGNQYLVVGSFLPPRVNVISHTQVIDFAEMVRRLSRAFAAREKK